MGNVCKVLHTVLITNIEKIQVNIVLLRLGWELRNDWPERVQGRVQISMSRPGSNDFGIKFMEEGSGLFVLKIN